MRYKSENSKASDKYKKKSPTTASVIWSHDRIQLRVFAELPYRYIAAADCHISLEGFFFFFFFISVLKCGLDHGEALLPGRAGN